ncbi:TIR domain-containing protein [Dictyobacter alpinus]|nr:TIR domain-containing protein [Dictyobacter alpinus]
MNIKVFVNCSRKDKDELLWQNLKIQLTPYTAKHNIQLWNANQDIKPGQNIKQEIDTHLQAAHIFFFLLSADYFSDSRCMQQHQQALMRQQQDKESVTIIPILLRHCSWEDADLENIQLLPLDHNPIASATDPDKLMRQVSQEIRAIIEQRRSANEVHTQPSQSDQARATLTSSSEHKKKGNSYTNPAPVINASVFGNNYGQIINNHGSNFSNGGTQAREFRVSNSLQQDEIMDIGIIIALKEEFAVLYADIANSCEAINDIDTGEYYYQFERPSRANTRPYRCIATFIGNMGPVKATLQTQKMITRWHPSTLVMVGIAASLNADAKVGDVIIADQIDAYLDNAKAAPMANLEGYELKFSGSVYRATGSLIKAVQHFEFSSPTLFQSWQDQSKVAQQQLLAAQYTELIKAGLLREQAQIIEGHIASGPIIGASQAFQHWLKTHDRKYLALEMEAAGLMATVYEQTSPQNTLVLRAISDNGDEAKKELDNIGNGLLRRYAMGNAIKLLWGLLEARLLPQHA